jgi:hypothetical protein
MTGFDGMRAVADELVDESVIRALLVAKTRSEDCRRCDFMRPDGDR